MSSPYVRPEAAVAMLRIALSATKDYAQKTRVLRAMAAVGEAAGVETHVKTREHYMAALARALGHLPEQDRMSVLHESRRLGGRQEEQEQGSEL